MSRNARALVLALAVVVLVVGFVVAQQAGDDDDSSSASSTVTQSQPAGEEAAKPEASGTGKAEAPEAEPEPAEPKPPLVEVVGAQPVGGVQELVFEEGGEADFRVRSDIDEEIHVHGYDVTKALPAGKTVRVRFPADITGRFEVELHGAAVEIARLEVQP